LESKESEKLACSLNIALTLMIQNKAPQSAAILIQKSSPLRISHIIYNYGILQARRDLTVFLNFILEKL